MAEAEFVLKPDFDITKAQAKINKLNREFEASKRKAEEISKAIEKLENERKDIKFRISLDERALENINAKIESLEQKKLSIPVDDSYAIAEIEAEIAKARQLSTELENSLNKNKAEEQKITTQIQKQNNLLSVQNGKTATIKEKISLAKNEQTKFGKEIKKSNNPLEKFVTHVKGLVKRVFIFSVITKALRAMREALSGYIKQDSKLSSSIAKLKGNLATIGATLSSAISPILTVIVDKLVSVTNLVGATLAKLLGKDVKQMQKLADSTQETAESAEKATASFDTLQKIDTSGKSSSNSSNINTGTGMETVDISAYPMLSALASIDMTPLNESLERLNTAFAPYKTFIYEGLQWLWSEILVPLADWTITELLPHFLELLSAALEALNPIIEAIKPGLQWIWDEILKPLADWLGQAVIDVLEWLTEKLTKFAEWAKENPEDVQIIADIILSFLGGLLFYLATKKVIELISNLRHALIKMGGLKGIMSSLGSAINSPALAIAALAAAAIFWVKNWKKIKNSFKGMESWQKAVVIILGVAAAVAVLITALTVGVGAAAIVAGLAAIGLGAGILAIGNANEKKSKETKVQSTAAATSSVNTTLSSLKIGDYGLPALATGAVLPGGSPMLAWVNDQPKGHGYIEGSVENIAAAFEKYLGNHNFGGNQNVTIEAKGNWAQFIKFMNLQIKQENTRSTAWG